MPPGTTQPRLTHRDLEVLTALDHCPMTAAQILAFSRSFPRPFTSERRVRERMQQLCESGRAACRQYATATRGALNYYTLTRLGYRLLHGADAVPPAKRYFDPVPLARQHHTQSLADFVAHTAACAPAAGVRLTGFYREHTLTIRVGDATLHPDCAFLLVPAGGGPELRFFVEIDNSTERVRSDGDMVSWERKVRLYERLAAATPKRFRVLVVATRSGGRLGHILATAAELASNKDRSLFYGVHLPKYLAEPDALRATCFTDHRGRSASLVPKRLPREKGGRKSTQIAPAPWYAGAPVGARSSAV